VNLSLEPAPSGAGGARDGRDPAPSGRAAPAGLGPGPDLGPVTGGGQAGQGPRPQ